MASVETERTLYLSTILEHVREVVAERKQQAPRAELERAAAGHQPRGFAQALRRRAMQGPAIIAELKKASPSKGLIRPDFDPVPLALSLAEAGAAALSVLTEERFFQGSLNYLRGVSQKVAIPCLRKDFMVDPWQMVEARAHGADAVLLIVAALTDAELRTLREEARRCELDVLCEVHDREEVERALSLGCECVGVNSRNLKTFEVSLDRACELAALLPDGTVHVAESGIHTPENLSQLRAASFEAFLVGESLMRQERPAQALRALLGQDEASASLQ